MTEFKTAKKNYFKSQQTILPSSIDKDWATYEQFTFYQALGLTGSPKATEDMIRQWFYQINDYTDAYTKNLSDLWWRWLGENGFTQNSLRERLKALYDSEVDIVGVLTVYSNLIAGYSLQRLSTRPTDVVRVRRDSDNTEADFSANEVSNGTLVDWVNEKPDIYTSIFQTSVDGWSGGAALTLTTNQTQDGVSGALKTEFTGTGQAYMFRTTQTANRTYNISVDIWIDPNNSAGGQIAGIINDAVTAYDAETSTTGEWVTVTATGVFATNTPLRIGNRTGATTGDIYYYKNIVVTESSIYGFQFGSGTDSWFSPGGFALTISNVGGALRGTGTNVAGAPAISKLITGATIGCLYRATIKIRAIADQTLHIAPMSAGYSTFITDTQQLTSDYQTLVFEFVSNTDNYPNLFTLNSVAASAGASRTSTILDTDEYVEIDEIIIEKLENQGFVSKWYDQSVPTSKQRMFVKEISDYVQTPVAYGSAGRWKFKFVLGEGSTIFAGVMGGRVVANSNEVLISVGPTLTNTIYARVNGGSLITSSTLNYNTEYNVELTWDGSGYELFINGVSAGTGTYTGTITPTNIRIMDVNSVNRALKASIYDVEIYDATDTLVASYNGYGNTNEYWRDQTSSNDGVVNGSPLRLSTIDYTTTSSDGVQSTTANQPKLVENGTLITNPTNSLPAIKFDGTDDYLITNTVFSGEFLMSGVFENTEALGGAATTIVYGNRDSVNNRVYIGAFDTNELITGGVSNLFGLGSNALVGTSDTNTAKAFSVLYNGSTAKIYVNGSQEDSETPSASPVNTTAAAYIGALNDNGTPAGHFEGYVQEIVADNIGDESIIVALQNNQKNRWNI